MKSAKYIVASALVAALAISGCSSSGPDTQTQEVIDAISEIGDVSLESDDAIEAARDAYDDLNDKQQENVENYKTLTKAESKLTKLQEEKSKEDQSKADEVIATIDAIGEVTLDKADAVSQARKAYTALDRDQKTMVTNVKTLDSAEEQIRKLKQALNVGDTVSTSNWNVTLTNAQVSGTLQSSQSSTYWTPSDGSCFLILEFDVECLTSDKPTVDGKALTNLTANYNGNTYSSWEMQYIESQLWLYIHNTYLDANLPLHLYVYTYLPDSALNDGSSVTVDLTVDGQQKNITVR